MTAAIPTPLPRIALLVVTGFQLLSAAAGGVGLLAPGSMGIPLDVIAGSVFESFLWPALVLLIVVGGTQALALATLVRRAPTGLFWTAVAGFGMVVWILVEVAIMQAFVLLHAIYAATGLAQLALAIALLGVLPRVVARDASLDAR